MKTVLLRYSIGLALVCGTAPALADHQGGGQGKGMHGDPAKREQRMQRMREHLGLSDEQVEQMQAIRESGAGREEKRERMRAVLTEEQRATMDAHRAQMHGKGHHRQGRTADERIPDEEEI